MDLVESMHSLNPHVSPTRDSTAHIFGNERRLPPRCQTFFWNSETYNERLLGAFVYQCKKKSFHRDKPMGDYFQIFNFGSPDQTPDCVPSSSSGRAVSKRCEVLIQFSSGSYQLRLTNSFVVFYLKFLSSIGLLFCNVQLCDHGYSVQRDF